MKRPSSRFYLAFGLSSLLVSLYMLAVFAGLVPDREQAIRAGRATIAETIAVSCSILLSREDRAPLNELLQFILQRNRDIESLGIRDAKGELVTNVGAHASRWSLIAQETSTENQLQVPIYEGRQKWGTAEIRFAPLGPSGWRGLLLDPRVKLGAFLMVASFALFYWYLRRMLRHLDPARAIPARVRAALDTLAEGLLVLDPKGYIVLSNNAFSEVVGISADALIGQPVGGLAWSARDGARIESTAELPWHSTLEEGQPQRNETVYLSNAGGSRRTFRVNCTPVLGAGVKQTPVLVSLDDITELEEKEIQLRAAKDEADAANRAKSDFLANMSHEIRTPMNAILGFTELLRRNYQKGETDIRKHLNTIHSSGKHLLELINDILDLSKVEAGRIEIELIDCSPAAVLREVVKVLGVKAAEKSIGLVLEFDGPLPEKATTDPSRLRQIVTNLIGNAIKFTENGVVRVIPRLAHIDGLQRLTIDVADSGIGIPADKLETIFESFSQADTSINRRFGGTGLGLTISRQLARALGGDITVSSTPGSGSVFKVAIDPGALEGVRLVPEAELNVAVETLDAETQRKWVFPHARILVVDDGRENRELARLVLEEAGLEVSEAENGQIAVDMVAREQFACVLMDVQMPIMDGMTATRTLRERGYSLPVLALTANVMKGFEREIEASGFSGYLSKPIDIDAMLHDLAQRLGGTRAEETPATAETIVPASAPAPATIEAVPLLEAVSADIADPIVSRLANHPRLRRVVARFVKELPPKLEAMESASVSRNMTELAALAHWLKGAGGTVGFDAFFEPARALEEHAKIADEHGIRAAMTELHGIASRIVAPPDEPTAAA